MRDCNKDKLPTRESWRDTTAATRAGIFVRARLGVAMSAPVERGRLEHWQREHAWKTIKGQKKEAIVEKESKSG